MAGAPIQRDWVLEMEEAGKVNSIEMQHYVGKMGTQLEFNAVEVATILGYQRAESVYALCDSGRIGYLSRGKGKHRYYVFPRASVMKYLQENCNKI